MQKCQKTNKRTLIAVAVSIRALKEGVVVTGKSKVSDSSTQIRSHLSYSIAVMTSVREDLNRHILNIVIRAKL